VSEPDPIKRLRAFAAEAAAKASPSPAEQVRRLGARRHRRRVVATTTAAACAVLALAGGAVATANTVLDRAEGPVVTTPSPSPTPAPTTSPPSASPRPSPSAPSAPSTPSPSAQQPDRDPSPAPLEPTQPSPTQAQEPSPQPTWVSTIPDDFPLGTQMLPGAGDYSEPKRSDQLRTPWQLDPCTPTAYPTDADRTDFRTVEQTGPEYADIRQLGLYPDEAVAAEVLAGFRRVLAACAEEPMDTDPAYESRWETRGQDDGEEGLLAVGSYYREDSQVPGGAYVAVVRVGNAVLMVTRSNESMPRPGAENTHSRDVRALGGILAGEMCVFSGDGC